MSASLEWRVKKKILISHTGFTRNQYQWFSYDEIYCNLNEHFQNCLTKYYEHNQEYKHDMYFNWFIEIVMQKTIVIFLFSVEDRLKITQQQQKQLQHWREIGNANYRIDQNLAKNNYVFGYEILTFTFHEAKMFPLTFFFLQFPYVECRH